MFIRKTAYVWLEGELANKEKQIRVHETEIQILERRIKALEEACRNAVILIEGSL